MGVGARRGDVERADRVVGGPAVEAGLRGAAAGESGFGAAGAGTISPVIELVTRNLLLSYVIACTVVAVLVWALVP